MKHLPLILYFKTMKLFGSTENLIDKIKNGENVKKGKNVLNWFKYF